MLHRDNKRARLLPSATLDPLGDDLLIRCASYLDADGLAKLGRTSKRFGVPQAGQRRSLVNEAAHQWFRQSATDEERSRLPKYDDESDVGLYHALESLRHPLCFDELAGKGFSPQEHPARVTKKDGDGFDSTAMSGQVMRGGTHFVEFAVSGNDSTVVVNLGVIRPLSLTNGILEADWGWEWNVDPVNVSSRYIPAAAEILRSQRTARWGDGNINCCTYYCDSGRCFWTDWNNRDDISDWQGREGLEASGTIGLLLDLDEGTLSVFKDGRRLGEMKGGLDGEYCWFATVYSACTISISKDRAPN